ncbi:hypothetical protein FAZ69_14465 [Trinickia terrae]|uniref:Uncharacterized protein n=1 Tax=Trinickia terrae TaxID=2571161 RepID=A0A4U1I545_9BURK|nr:hypothetical protein [Trinickia terrae]TKC88347.1 hypothetical protein FAZ69_14465 [Trinickia terrae]
MTLKHLPPTFCWTKIGNESGEALPTIVLRKEWERRLGGGRFLWGISQPLDGSAKGAAHRIGSLMALFSPASSNLKAVNAKREDVLLWNAWIDSNGQVRPLPPHTFITSPKTLPSGRRREHHFALVCSSPTELSIGSKVRAYPELLRNVSTGKAPGAALSTAVVECIGQAGEQPGKSYPIVLAVELETPYFVRLAQPSLVKARDLAAINQASRKGDFETWIELTRRFRSRPSIERARGFTRDLFDMPSGESVAPMSNVPAAHSNHASRPNP